MKTTANTVTNPSSTTGASVTLFPTCLGIQLDWLSISCYGNVKQNYRFTVKRRSLGTRIFKCVDDYYTGNDHIATIQYCPSSSILRQDLHIVKFSNKFLYTYSDMFDFKQFIDELGLQFNAINRVDLCIDFQEFITYNNPAQLIKDFTNEKIIHLGKAKFKVQGKTSESITYEYMRFGSNTSQISVYMYNKSTEMKEVKEKAHIREKWLKHNFKDDKDVWRLEISIKESNVTYTDKSTGESVRLDLVTVTDQQILRDIYFSIINKYFRFKINEKKSNISRNRDLLLFNEQFINYQRIYICNIKDSNRSDKIYLKKMEQHFSELREQNKEIADLVRVMQEFYVADHRLGEWYNEKILPFRRSDEN